MKTTTEILAATEALAVKLDEALELAGRLPDSAEKAHLVQILTDDVLMVQEITAWLRGASSGGPAELSRTEKNVAQMSAHIDAQIADMKHALGALGLGPPPVVLT